MMKSVYSILCLLLVVTSSCAMEKRKEPEQGQQEQGGGKCPRVHVVPEPRVIGFADLPADVQRIIFNLIVTPPGRTNAEKLHAASGSLRNFMTLNKSFKTNYLDNEAINGYLIQQLAQRYTNGNLVEAALALRTVAGGRWLMSHSYQLSKEFRHAILALHKAVEAGDLNVVSFLVKFMPNIINAQNNAYTALMLASEQGRAAIVERLLAAPGIEVNWQNVSGDTTLALAVEHGEAAIVKQLLAKPGINANVMDSEGFTALMIASYGGHATIVEHLLTFPEIVEVNLQSRNGSTALMLAAEEGDVAIVARLLAVPEINVNLRDNFKKTALGIAQRSDIPHKEAIIKLLKDHGAVE